MNHFTDIEVYRWAKWGTGEDKARLVEHVASCDECSRRYAKAIREQPLSVEPADDVREFIAAGYKAANRKPRWMWPAAAAAILVLLISIPLLTRRQHDAVLTLRGNTIQAISPSGDVPVEDIRFLWASGIAAPRFRVTVYDVKGEIFTMIAERAPLTIAAGQLEPGINYWWSVTALDPAGKALVTSERRAFTVRR